MKINCKGKLVERKYIKKGDWIRFQEDSTQETKQNKKQDDKKRALYLGKG